MFDNDDDSRQAVAALLKAAANPNLSDAQARILTQEAKKNAELAFGLSAPDEIARILSCQIVEDLGIGAANLHKLHQALFDNEKNDEY